MAEQVVVQAGDPGRAGDAAQAEDGDPLDVGPQAEPADEPGVDGGRGDAGDRGEHQQVHIGRGRVPPSAVPRDGLGAQIEARRG